MKKLLLLLMVVGLVMAASGTASVLAQTTYELYADVKSDYSASDFRLRYIDLDGDGKFSFDELISFSGVGWTSQTYTEILGVPSDTTDSPLTDGPNWDPVFYSWWYFYEPGAGTGIYTRPNAWTYSQVPVTSKISMSKPGITVVQDDPSDFLLRRCDPDFPSIPCSLPPSTQPPPSTLPGYFDIESASITQINRGLVELVIKVYEPIPAVPYISPGTPYGFVSYIWQFQGGCVEPKTGNKDSISVVWTYWEDDQIWEWRAYWYVITGCAPRAIERGHRVPFKFIEDGVKVWVPLRDLLTAIDPDPGYLEWHAAVRRIPFIYHPEGYPNFPNTAAVDYAPDVLEFLDCGLPPLPPCAWVPEDFATWEPR